MGRKKGKQSGAFSSKAMRAAHVTELRDRISEVRHSHHDRNNQRSTWGCRCQSQSSPKSSHDASSERPKVELTRLRGFLQERQLWDRLVDHERRRRLRATTRTEAPSESTSLATVHRHEPGWILSYDIYRDTTAAPSSGQSGKRHIPSLQHLALRALAPVLSDYVIACGVQPMHSMLGFLPSPTLAELSALVSSTNTTINDDLVIVLGRHTHLDRLALHASDNDAIYDDTEDDESETCRQLTDAGLLALVPRLVSSHTALLDSALDGTITLLHTEQITDSSSWEELDVESTVILQGCGSLKRLELVNARNISVSAMTFFCKSFSTITHLSISGSFDVISGPIILLHTENGILELLTNLQVLDLSHCHWMTDAILTAFIERVLQHNNKNNNHHRQHIAMISIAGCWHLSTERQKELNLQLQGRPLLSSAIQKRNIPDVNGRYY